MNIRFGLHLDSQRGWRAGNRLAAPVMGPLSLLSLLETQLGLARDFPTRAERIVQYRECLKTCDSPSRFYHATFAADELGTAARLLEWRDSWHLHGWTGGFRDGSGARLMDMAAVEERAAGSVGPSVGERLKSITEGLRVRNTRCPHPSPSPAAAGEGTIGRIFLVDPLEAFSRRWRSSLTPTPTPCLKRSGSGTCWNNSASANLRSLLRVGLKSDGAGPYSLHRGRGTARRNPTGVGASFRT